MPCCRISRIEAGTIEMPTPAATKLMAVSICSTSATTSGVKPALWQTSRTLPYMPGAAWRRTRISRSPANARSEIGARAGSSALDEMMLRRQRDQHVFLCQLFEDQIRRSRHGRSDDCNLHLFAEQRFGQALSAVRMEIERYRGVIVDVGPQRARDGGV